VTEPTTNGAEPGPQVLPPPPFGATAEPRVVVDEPVSVSDLPAGDPADV
jgi:hypothetical protein